MIKIHKNTHNIFIPIKSIQKSYSKIKTFYQSAPLIRIAKRIDSVCKFVLSSNISTRSCFKIPFMSLEIDYPRSLILETDSGYANMGRIIKFRHFSKYKIYYIIISF